MFRLPWNPPMTKSQLQAISDPQSAGQPECIPWILYDSATFTTNSTTSMTLFQTVQTDKTLGNMQSAGQLPDPQHFLLHYVTFDVLTQVTTTSGGVAGALNDIELIMKVGRPTFTLTMADKQYGPFPLRACHALGGATGGAAGTWTAEENLSWANNGIPGGGGYPFGGAVVIPPKVGFSVRIDWAAVQVTVGSPVCSMGLAGVLYRKVL